MKRGDIATVSARGDVGKPRPALVIQDNLFQDTDSITVLLMTSTQIEAPLFRLSVEPDSRNGLARVSYIQVDKAMTIRRERSGAVIGRLDETLMVEVSRL